MYDTRAAMRSAARGPCDPFPFLLLAFVLLRQMISVFSYKMPNHYGYCYAMNPFMLKYITQKTIRITATSCIMLAKNLLQWDLNYSLITLFMRLPAGDTLVSLVGRKRTQTWGL